MIVEFQGTDFDVELHGNGTAVRTAEDDDDSLDSNASDQTSPATLMCIVVFYLVCCF